jgi:hypothetical protein
MKILNIEVLSGKSVLLQELPSGDVEIIVSELKDQILEDRRKWPSSYKLRGMHDTVIAVIPKHRRKLVADYLNNI